MTAAQQGAIGNLTNLGTSGNPFSSAVGGVANNLLGGGGANQYAPMINSAYSQYQQQQAPFANGQYTDPASNPALQKYLQVARDDATNSINQQFAGAGRDLSGMNSQALGRGIGQAEAPILYDAYNQSLGRQLQASNNLYNAGGNTAGLLSGLNQTGLGNQQAGIGAAQQAFTAQQSGPMLALQAQSQLTGIPMEILAQQAGIALPAAQAFGSTTGTQVGNTNQTGTNQMSGAQQFGLIASGLKNLYPGSSPGNPSGSPTPGWLSNLGLGYPGFGT